VAGILPDQHGPLVVQPALAASTFAQVATTVTTGAHNYRIPIVSADPTAAWVAEGAEITPSDPTLQELTVTPPKVAGLTIISRELADDSNPAATQVVGDGLARDIARRIDPAAFAGLSAPAPAGLTALSGVQTYVNANAFTNLDFAAQAIGKAETVGRHGDRVRDQPGDRARSCHRQDRRGQQISRC
jgi:HK97 family phage major capsid protein